jgi:hypothetical protein
MPKQRGVFKINGTIDDTTFYERKGVFFARRATKGPTKQQILTSPRYARTRENMAEFNALAVTTKSIVSTVSKASEFKDGTLRNRLMRTSRKMIKNGAGVRGKRPAMIVANKGTLVNLEFNAAEPLSSLFIGEKVMTHDVARNKATSVVTGATIREVVTNAPQGATHVRFVQLLGAVSNTVFDETLKKHIPADALLNGKHVVTYSDYQALDGNAAINVQLQTSLPDGLVLTDKVGVIQCFGVVFDALSDGVYYRQAQGKAMTIVDVF